MTKILNRPITISVGNVVFLTTCLSLSMTCIVLMTVDVIIHAAGG